jgi:3-hydroxyacyl-CoA dehydrogenase
MRLVEVVRGGRTAKEVIATAMTLSKRIGKVPVLVGVCHGFVGNRMLAARSREANKLILEGAAPEQVDRVLYDFGFPMGPFAMSDLAGLDVGWSAARSTGATVRERLCEAGRRGQKTRAGYYDYEPESRTPKPSAAVRTIIEEVAARNQIRRREVGDEEILERCLYPMVNEAAKILEEGVALRASDIDIIWVYGYGWPVYRGGPMFWADSVGLDRVLTRLRELEREQGPEWKPASRLESLAATGGGFLD